MLAELVAAATSLVVPAPVSALAHAGDEVAVASACEVRVWSPPARRATLVGSTRCDRTSTGTGIAAVSVASGRVLWLRYTGGNIRDWSLYTATTRTRKAHLVRTRSADVDARPPIVIGAGYATRYGDILPYAIGEMVVALRSNGARRFAWSAPSQVVALASTGGGLAVASAGGRLTILDWSGRIVQERSYPTEISAVELTGSGVVVQHGRTLAVEIGQTTRYTLERGARLEDAAADRAFVSARGVLYTISFYDGARRTIARGQTVEAVRGGAATAAGRRVTLRQLPPLP